MVGQSKKALIILLFYSMRISHTENKQLAQENTVNL